MHQENFLAEYNDFFMYDEVTQRNAPKDFNFIIMNNAWEIEKRGIIFITENGKRSNAEPSVVLGRQFE
jgi:hypothetical protein